MEYPTVNVEKLRKGLWYVLPMFSALAALCGWMTWELITMLHDVNARVPVVRVWPGSVVGPAGLVFFGTALVLALVRGAAYEGPAMHALDKVLLYSGLLQLCLIALVLVASSAVQNHAMPLRGYVQCSLLQGNPSLWFTDWLQDPALCARGKDKAWVLEQLQTSRP